MNNEMMIFIPRVNMDVNKKVLNDVFESMSIGKVISADFYKKRNYQYVFLKLDMKSSNAVRVIQSLFEKNGKTRIIMENYKWELKPYIPPEKRTKSIQTLRKELMQFPELKKPELKRSTNNSFVYYRGELLTQQEYDTEMLKELMQFTELKKPEIKISTNNSFVYYRGELLTQQEYNTEMLKELMQVLKKPELKRSTNNSSVYYRGELFTYYRGELLTQQEYDTEMLINNVFNYVF